MTAWLTGAVTSPRAKDCVDVCTFSHWPDIQTCVPAFIQASCCVMLTTPRHCLPRPCCSPERAEQPVAMQEEIEALFISVRDIILARPSEDIAELAGLINNSPRRRRMRELELDDLQHLLQVSGPDLPPSFPPPPPPPPFGWLQRKGSSFGHSLE